MTTPTTPPVLLGKGRPVCQHTELYFTDGAFQLICPACKGHWYAGFQEPEDRFRGSEWIENPTRVSP